MNSSESRGDAPPIPAMIFRNRGKLSLTLKMGLVTVAAGLLVWAVTGFLVSRAIQDLFRTSLTEQLTLQDQDFRLRFERYILSFQQAVKLYAGLQSCVNAVERADWTLPPAEIVPRDTAPEWFVSNAVQRHMVSPNYALLLDTQGRVREAYSALGDPIPPGLLKPTRLLLRRTHSAGYVTFLDGLRFIASSSPVVNSRGETTATLMIASRLDERFLKASQGSFTEGIVVALVQGDPPTVFVSSDSKALPPGTPLAQATAQRLARRQAFFQFGSGDADFKFVSLASTAKIDELTESFNGKERLLGAGAACVYIVVFALLMLGVTRRVRSLTGRVAEYAFQLGLGADGAKNAGDELDILEKRFRFLMDQVRQRTEQLESAYAHLQGQAAELAEANELLKELDELKSANLAAVSGELRVISQAIEQSPVSVAITDSSMGITYVNPRFEESTGFSRAQIFGRNPLEFKVADPLAQESRKGIEESLAAGREWRGEFRSRTSDGSLRWVQAVVSPVRDDSGVVTHFLFITQDVTLRRQAEEELRALRNYLSNVIDSMPSILVGVDRECRITHWNAAASSQLGQSLDAVSGRPLSEVFPRMSAHVDDIAMAVAERLPRRIERESYHDRDAQGFQDVVIYPLVRNGVEGAVVRVDDVTERVRIEEMMIQSEKMMSLGGLAAGMAHEINNPLSAVLQSVQVVLGHLDPAKEANRRVAAETNCDIDCIRAYLEKRNDLYFLQSIREAGERATRIVRNMLEFSRKSETVKTPSDINALLDKSVELAQNDYDLKKNYDFRKTVINRRYQPDLPPVLCSRTEIEQVVLNLLKNAAQAMGMHPQDRQPAIELRTSLRGDHVLIEIEDNGPGMDETLRKRIFEPFFTTKGPGEGTGLGLSVSYFIIVTNHQGSISVDSAPGVGTRFSITLPLSPSGAIPAQ